MSATVRDTGPFEKLIGFVVTESELDRAKTKAARRLSREIKIKGFRPGKAPRPIVEATVGAERLRAEAIEEILPEKVGEVLDEAELAPAVTPAVEKIDDTDDGIEVEVRVTLWPKLDDVPEHHDRRIEVGSPEVTIDELEDQIERIRDQFAELEPVGRPATAGDYVSIDISATHQGEEVPEARASDLLYEVGSEGFIEGIDEVLEGMAAGETRTFEAELPAGFGDKGGLDVTVTVTVTEVQRKALPELTDEWVAEMTEFETVEEMREELRDQMANLKKQSLVNRFREKALEELVDHVDVALPEALVRAEMDAILHRFAHRLQEREISLDDYFRVTGISQEQFLSDLENQADRSLRTRLLLEAVADLDGLEVTDEEYEAVIEAIVAQSDRQSELRQALAGAPRDSALVGDILRNKALEAIVAGAIPVDEDGNTVDLTIEEPARTAQVVEGEIVDADADDVPMGQVVEAEVVGPDEVGEEE